MGRACRAGRYRPARCVAGPSGGRAEVASEWQRQFPGTWRQDRQALLWCPAPKASWRAGTPRLQWRSRALLLVASRSGRGAADPRSFGKATWTLRQLPAPGFAKVLFSASSPDTVSGLAGQESAEGEQAEVSQRHEDLCLLPRKWAHGCDNPACRFEHGKSLPLRRLRRVLV